MTCAEKSNRKEIRRHIKQEVYKRVQKRRLSEHGKQNHGYQYAIHRGRAKVQNYVWLSCTAQNLKKMALLIHQPQFGDLFISIKSQLFSLKQ